MVRCENGRRDPRYRPHSRGGEETAFNLQLLLHVVVHDMSFGNAAHWHPWTRVRLGSETVNCCNCCWNIPRRHVYWLHRHLGTKGERVPDSLTFEPLTNSMSSLVSVPLLHPDIPLASGAPNCALFSTSLSEVVLLLSTSSFVVRPSALSR